MSDIELAFETIIRKQPRYSELFSYADGNQPLKYSTERLREAFKAINVKFVQNWCSVVIESALDRMQFRGWTSENKAINSALEKLYTEQEIVLDSYDVHRSSLITSEAYIIAWKDDTGTQVYYNDPRICHVFYEASNPKKARFAAKMYKDELSRWILTLYYPDHFEYYETRPMKNSPRSYKDFAPSEISSAPNDYGVIPVFHFRLNQRSHIGDLDNIITLQDAVNKLLSDMMVSAEFSAFQQRYVITDAETAVLKNAPNEIWSLPGGSSVGQFAATNLDNYLNSIDKIANSIAIISRTPKHYFYGSDSQVSGEALLAMEAPLTKKVTTRIDNFSSTWTKLAKFLCLMNGINVKDDEIKTVWEPAQSVQPYTEALTIKTLTDAGVPLKSALRMSGQTDKEIEQVERDKAEEEANATTMATALLDQARKNNEQNNDPDQIITAGTNADA